MDSEQAHINIVLLMGLMMTTVVAMTVLAGGSAQAEEHGRLAYQYEVADVQR